MKASSKPVIDKLLLDVIEYAFVEWLIRRGIFTAFRANCDRIPGQTFQDCLREQIRYVYSKPSLGPESLVSSAFVFTSTPEGYEFWTNHSDAWRRFYDNL